ncbi:MAG: sugar MFS transporter [Cellvibrio sp.]|uniref:sugar MFS transporter n=1 Tax=Cellvibrio sp. TaxID=1965322 RepID=UPI0031B32C64
MNDYSYKNSTLIPMAIIGMLFFIFGFVTWLNGSLIPLLEVVCELNSFEALFVTFAFYAAYTIMAIPSSLVLMKIGYKNGMAAGLGIMALGALIFIPAAKLATFSIFLIGLFVLGAGLTLLQTAANPYVVCIGPQNSAAVRVSIMGVINKSAGVIAPIVFTAYVLTGMDQYTKESLALLNEEARQAQLTALSQRLVSPYIGLAVTLFILMLFIKVSPLPELECDGDKQEGEKLKLSGILKYPHTILGALALFMGVGVEVIAGDTIGLYGKELGLAHFGMLTSYTMAFMVLGYIAGILLIPRYVKQESALAISALLGILFTCGIVFSSPQDATLSHIFLSWLGIPVIPNSIFFLALLGMANALVWPAIWPLALNGLGRYTGIGSALLIMSIAGGALLPLVFGGLSHSGISHQHAYITLFFCYLVILFYAVKGHKITHW